MTIEQRLGALERNTSRWRLLCGLELLMLLGLCTLFFNRHESTVQAGDGILRGRGLILSDASGKARILFGAPFPDIKDRIRQDERTSSIVFLDDQGHDRLVLGEALPVQRNGIVPPNLHRIGSGYGITLHDLQGNERGGMNFLSNGRVSIALDRPNGDAWGALVDDKTGFAGTLSIYDRNVGDGATGIFSGTQGKRAFFTIKGLDDVARAELAVGPDQKPTLTIFNEQGKDGKDILQNLSPATR